MNLDNKIFKKYFWDHTQNASDEFKLKRLIEYASFPDLMKIPFELVKANFKKIDFTRLRTSQKRIEFMIRLGTYIPQSSTWEEAIFRMAGVN